MTERVWRHAVEDQRLCEDGTGTGLTSSTQYEQTLGNSGGSEEEERMTDQ